MWTTREWLAYVLHLERGNYDFQNPEMTETWDVDRVLVIGLHLKDGTV